MKTLSRNTHTRAVLALIISGLVILTLTGCAPAPAADSLPFGEWLYRLVVGGPSVNGATLLRFYVWHVVGLSVPILALIIWHGFRVRRDGGISSPAREVDAPRPPSVERSAFVRQEVLVFFLTIAALILVSVLVDAPIGPAAEPGALVEGSHAPWIFLWIQELLRVWPPAIAGVLTPLVVLGLLALLPYLDWSNDGIAVWFNRQGRLVQVILVLVYAGVIALTIRGALR